MQRYLAASAIALLMCGAAFYMSPEHMDEMATSLNMDLSNAMAWVATTAMRLHGL